VLILAIFLSPAILYPWKFFQSYAFIGSVFAAAFPAAVASSIALASTFGSGSDEE
jgi:hypothetical protein